MDGEAQEIAEELQDTRRAPVQPPVADDGLRHPGGSAHRGGGGPVSPPPAAGVSPDFPEIPLLFLALGAGVLWLLVLLFTLVKAACDRRDRRRWPTSRPCWTPSSRRTPPWPRALREAQIRRDHAQKYFEAVSQQSGGPYLPLGGGGLLGPPSTRWSRRSPSSRGQLTALGTPVAVDAQLDEVEEETARLQADYDALRSPSRPCKPPTGSSTPGSPPAEPAGGGLLRPADPGAFPRSPWTGTSVTVGQAGFLTPGPWPC